MFGPPPYGQGPYRHPFMSAAPFSQFPAFPESSTNGNHGARPVSAPPVVASRSSTDKTSAAGDGTPPAAKRTKARRVYPNVKPFVGNLFNLCNDPECVDAIRYHACETLLS